jgi:general nucleoside transport system permease protein
VSWAAVAAVLASGVALATPLLWAALGETINEQAGIFNVGIEGVMLSGAFGAALGLHYTGSLGLGVLVAGLCGLLCGCVLAYLYVNQGADQIVTGVLFVLLALGLTTMLYEAILKQVIRVPTFPPIRIPGLSAIPLIGGALFAQPILGYLAFLLAPVVFFVLRRTWFGLYVRSLGERPAAADSAGLSVTRLRWAALLLGCTLVAMGGAALVLDVSGNFIPNVTSGQGFIAIVIVMLCRWDPLLAVGGALMFGVATAADFQLQLTSALRSVPSSVWLAIPYIIAIVAITVSRGKGFPRAAGIPYFREGAPV